MFHGTALAGMVCLAGIGTLFGLDYARIGRIPAPCATAPDWQADAALVLSGGPHLRRTRQAVRLYQAGHLPVIAFSGAGHGGDSAKRLMHAAETRLGVPATATVLEDQARSTYENFRFSCRLPRLAAARRIAIVTDQPHSWRAWATARVQCPAHRFCSAPAPVATTPARRRDESFKLWVYQLLGRAAWW